MTTTPDVAVPSSEPAPHTDPRAPQSPPYAGPPAAYPYGAQPQPYGTQPQFHGAQPQFHGAQPHGAQFHGAQPQHHPAAGPGRNVLGIVALGIGVLALLGGTVSLFIQAGLLTSGNFAALRSVLEVLSTIQAVLALAAIVCGAIGLALKGRSKALAGIGLGVGVAVLWSILGGAVYGAVVQLIG